MTEDFGLLTLLPVLVVILLAVWTRSTFEPLVVGLLTGCIIAYRGDFLNKFIEHLTSALTNKDSGWVILVCMLYGSLITMMIRAGGTLAFSNFILRFVKSRRSALLSTWLLGLTVFVDDYLHSLAVGASMKKVTDRFKISRELLAYVVHATSAPLCILLPLSTWSIFIGRVLEQNGLAAPGQGLTAYWNAIPYMAYGFAGITLVLLVVLGIVPIIGKMRQAEVRASGGQTIPSSASGEPLPDELPAATKNRGAYFVLPMLVLLGSTFWFDFDPLKGALVANVFTFAYLFIDHSLTLRQLSDALISGFNTILFPLILVILAFALKLVNDDLHLVEYVINGVKPIMSRELFPAVAFLTLAIVAFLTGSSWDLYVIAIPIIVPLAQALDANVWMAVSVVVSAGAFGSNAGFYSDSTILSAASSNCPTMTHALTQFPYTIIALGLSTLAYAVMGFIF